MPEDKIGKSLGLDPIREVKGEIVESEFPKREINLDKTEQETEQDNDWQYARENFYNVIEKGTQALEEMLDIAKASEHPRAYEVIATIMKTLTDTNKDLVEMGTKRSQKKDAQNEDGVNTTNNNLFVGSTAELQKMLEDMRNKDE